MCTDQTPAAHVLPARPQVLHDFDPGVVFDLEPVDAVTVTTLMDNVTDIFMPDQGPARRPPELTARGPRPSWRMATRPTRCWPSTGSRCWSR